MILDYAETWWEKQERLYWEGRQPQAEAAREAYYEEQAAEEDWQIQQADPMRAVCQYQSWNCICILSSEEDDLPF